MRGGVANLQRILSRARAEGRTHLLETEGLEIARHLGIGVPRRLIVSDPSEVEGLDLSALPGDRVVLKAVSAEIQHKSDVGAVRFVPKDSASVQQALTEMAARLTGCDVVGYTINELVKHDPSLGGQLLIGMRWTEDFGPVVTFGPGGVHAEFLARNFIPGSSSAIVSPLLASTDRIDEALEATAITPAATGRLRGQSARMSLADLRTLIGRFLTFAVDAMPQDVAEFEINPLVWTSGGPVALDALVRIGEACPARHPARPHAKLEHLLKPRSIALVGVSRGMNPGRIILGNLLREGFPREGIWIVKPGLAELEGCRCVPDVEALPEAVDLFVVCVDAPQVPEVVEQVVRDQKAESLILIAGGLGERRGTEAFVDRVRESVHASRATPWQGPVLNGGNCLGIRSLPGRYDTLFIPHHKLNYPDVPPTPLAVISQSGAFAVARASKLAFLNPRYLITLGNQLDLTVGDFLTHLKRDPEVDVFACYVEGFQPGDGEQWLRATDEITAGGRPVLLYRAGRTPAGAEATASHTASIAGDYAVTRALAEAAGAVVAESLADFDDLMQLFCLLRGKEVGGLRLGALSNAGFECVAMADNLGSFSLPEFGMRTQARLGALLESRRLQTVVGVKNLLDLTPIVGDEAYEEAVSLVLGDENVDVGVVGCVPLSGALETVPVGEGHGEDVLRENAVASRIARLHAASRKAWVAVVDAGPLYDSMAQLLIERGVPTFRTADRALRLFGRYCEWRLAHEG